MNYLPTCTSTLVVQHPCQVSFKSMQECRRSWEDKLKCAKILSFKGHNSVKICRTWIISPHALLHLWYNICTKFHSNPCKDVGGVEKTNMMGRKDGRTEWRNDGMTEWRTKQTLNAPVPYYGGGIKTAWPKYKCISYVVDIVNNIYDARLMIIVGRALSKRRPTSGDYLPTIHWPVIWRLSVDWRPMIRRQSIPPLTLSDHWAIVARCFTNEKIYQNRWIGQRNLNAEKVHTGYSAKRFRSGHCKSGW